MADREETVVVVGAGPTGLALTAELARLGIRALLLDKLVIGQNTSRATVVHARTLEVLEQLQVSERLIARGLKLQQGHLRDGAKIRLTLSFGDLPTAYPYALVCTQDKTEAVLNERLLELGGTVTRPAEVIAVTPGDELVEVRYRDADGAEHTVQTKWLVGCDGLHSLVRQSAGIGFEGGAYDESFVLADMEMEWGFDRESMNLFFTPEGITLVVPLPEERWRMVATDKAEPPQHPSVQDCQRLLDRVGLGAGAAKVQQVIWSSRFRIQHRVASQLRKGRVLVCGDAAHVHSPAGGQGMNTGVQDAVSLAEVLHQVLSTGDESGFAAWEQKRLAIAHDVVSTTDRMTKLAASQSTAMHMLRNAVLGVMDHLPALKESLVRKMSEIDNR